MASFTHGSSHPSHGSASGSRGFAPPSNSILDSRSLPLPNTFPKVSSNFDNNRTVVPFKQHSTAVSVSRENPSDDSGTNTVAKAILTSSAGKPSAIFPPAVDLGRFIPGLQGIEPPPPPTVSEANPKPGLPLNPNHKVNHNPKGSFKTAVQGNRTPKPPEVFVHGLNAVHPTMNNGLRSIEMPDFLYQERMKGYTYALHARLTLRKGDPPRFATDLHDELAALWHLSSPLRVIPLGRGFFTLMLSSAEDYTKAKSTATIKLRFGLLSIKDWSPKFDPYKQNNSSLIQIWTRIYYLPHEFWHPEFLTGVARAIGTPIKIDGQTYSGDVGHFARILIEIDMSQDLIYTIPVTRGADVFDIEFTYENLPHFCGICRIVGHSASHCRHRKDSEQVTLNETAPPPPKGNNDGFKLVTYKKPKQYWKNATRPSNSFAVLSGLGGDGDHAENSGQASHQIVDRQAVPSPAGIASSPHVVHTQDPKSTSSSFNQALGGQVKHDNRNCVIEGLAKGLSGPDILESLMKPVQHSVEDEERNSVDQGVSEEEEEEMVFDEQEHERTHPVVDTTAVMEDRDFSRALVVDTARTSADNISAGKHSGINMEERSPADSLRADTSHVVNTQTPLVGNESHESITRGRGRPKGATKKGKVSDSSIKHRLRRIIKNGMSSDFQKGRAAGAAGAVLDTPLPMEFLNKVQHAQSGGAIMQNFVVHSHSDAARAMSVVAGGAMTQSPTDSARPKEKWEDMLDDEAYLDKDVLLDF